MVDLVKGDIGSRGLVVTAMSQYRDVSYIVLDMVQALRLRTLCGVSTKAL